MPLTSTVYTPIEDEIAGLLKPLEAEGLRVDIGPLSKLAQPLARCTMYISETNGQQMAANGRSQARELSLVVTVELADQRSHQKIYPYLEAVENRLSGHRLSGAAMLTFERTAYQEMQEGSGISWRYVVQFRTTAMWVKQ